MAECTFPYYNWTRAEYPLTNVHTHFSKALYFATLVQLGGLVPSPACVSSSLVEQGETWKGVGCASATRPIIVTALEDMENSISLVLRGLKKKKGDDKEGNGRPTQADTSFIRPLSTLILFRTQKKTGIWKSDSHPGCWCQTEAYTDEFPNDNERNFFLPSVRIRQVATPFCF